MDISSLFLPKDLLLHFEFIKVIEQKDSKTNQDVFHIYLEEKKELPEGYNQLVMSVFKGIQMDYVELVYKLKSDSKCSRLRLAKVQKNGVYVCK